MNYYLAICINFSILIVGVIAILRFKKIDPAYYPFVYAVLIGCLIELVGFWLSQKGIRNLVIYNVYVLIEAALIAWLFKNLHLFKSRPKLFFALIAFYLLFWIIDNLLLGNINANVSYFRILYSFLTVLMSITLLNEFISGINRKVQQSSVALICLGFIIYFTYKILVQAFVLYGVTRSVHFLTAMYNIMLYINLGANIMYSFALLWIPRKLKFTTLFLLQ